MNRRSEFRSGDLVEVRDLTDIAATLDEGGMLDGLPFMPEMKQFCGNTFRISSRIRKTCVEGMPGMIGGFPADDLYFLDGTRCSGESHGDCQRYCFLIWKEAWLRSPRDAGKSTQTSSAGELATDLRVKTTCDDQTYHCQSTQLPKIAFPLTRRRRLVTCVQDVRDGSHGWLKMLSLVVNPLWRKTLRKCGGIVIRGARVKTPTESLNLQPGDVVEIKSLEEIRTTLDRNGFNRGMEFSPDMANYCGQTMTVLQRIDRIILEETGEMRQLKNTVMLDGLICNCPLVIGGCPRKEPHYWREIWLRRVKP